jgi:hypothetical protein
MSVQHYDEYTGSRDLGRRVRVAGKIWMPIAACILSAALDTSLGWSNRHRSTTAYGRFSRPTTVGRVHRFPLPFLPEPRTRNPIRLGRTSAIGTLTHPQIPAARYVE